MDPTHIAHPDSPTIGRMRVRNSIWTNDRPRMDEYSIVPVDCAINWKVDLFDYCLREPRFLGSGPLSLCQCSSSIFVVHQLSRGFGISVEVVHLSLLIFFPQVIHSF
jgi:hypothetical protein